MPDAPKKGPPEEGTVLWFDSREEKRYGFLVLAGGRQIFFHHNDGRPDVVSDWDEPTTPLRLPKAGEHVLFYRQPGKQGKPKACPWAYRVSE